MAGGQNRFRWPGGALEVWPCSGLAKGKPDWLRVKTHQTGSNRYRFDGSLCQRLFGCSLRYQDFHPHGSSDTHWTLAEIALMFS